MLNKCYNHTLSPVGGILPPNLDGMSLNSISTCLCVFAEYTIMSADTHGTRKFAMNAPMHDNVTHCVSMLVDIVLKENNKNNYIFEVTFKKLEK